MIKILLTLIAATTIFASCINNNPNNNSKPTLVVASDSATVKYQCPMKCEGDTAYTMAGQCPVCEMALEKVETNHVHHEHDSTHANH